MDKNKLNILLTNLVTSIRAVGIFMLIPIYELYGGLATFLASAVCFLSDSIDGAMARKLKSSTFFGSMFDGFTDKAFLAVNMVILASITPVAVIPILLEAGILGAGYLKYKNNENIQSSLAGKIKMWVAGLTISLSYLLIDTDAISYISADLASKLKSMDQVKLFSAVLTPLILSEIATLLSYIKKQDNTEEDNIINDSEEIEKEFEDVSRMEALFSHEYYEKYKDSNELEHIVKLTRKKK